MQQPVATATTRLFMVRHALVEPSARAMLYGAMDVALCDATLREEAALHRWLFTEHRAYAAGADPRSDAPPAAALDTVYANTRGLAAAAPCSITFS